MRVLVDRLKCESNGMCVTAAPQVFEVDDDDELIVLNESPDEELRLSVETAVRMCPKQALSIVE